MNLLPKIKLFSTSFVLFFLVISSSFAITPEEQLDNLIRQHQNEQALIESLDKWLDDQKKQALDELIVQWDKEQAAIELLDKWLDDQDKQALDELIVQWKNEQALDKLILHWDTEQLDGLIVQWENEQSLDKLILQWEIDYALAPIPEPETYAMMLAGLGLLGFVVRRRKQKLSA